MENSTQLNLELDNNRSKGVIAFLAAINILFFVIAFLIVMTHLFNTVKIDGISDDYAYEGTAVGVTLVKYLGNQEEIVIPQYINGIKVTALGKELFKNNTQLKTITIHNSVTSIESNAFLNCKNLKNVSIPVSVKSIGSYAFANCTSLEKIVVPTSVTNIDKGAFDNCSSLKEISLPFVGQEATSTTNSHFGYIFGAKTCSSNSSYMPSSLKNVVITGDKKIADDAFYNCNKIESITIPHSVASIGSGAFEDCSSLININIPSSVTSIGCDAFEGCSSLTNIVIPNSVTRIESYAFNRCSNLTIYAYASRTPSGWDVNWNPSSCYVVWGYKGDL